MSARSDRVKVIEQAEKYVRGGRIKEAIAEYEKLALGDPQDVGTINIIGDLYIRLGHTDKAVRAFEKVAEEYEKRGLYSQALAISKKIHKLVPDHVDAALKLGELYAQQGFVADAKKVFAAVAGRLAEAGRTAESVAIFEKVVKLDREDTDARRALAGLFRSVGNVESALDQLNELALVLGEKGRFEAAESALREALSIRPGDGRSVVGLVEVFKRQGRTERAVELLEKELQAAPDNVQFLNVLGNLHFEAGETKRAEEIFTRIVTGHPLNVNARIKLGRIQILKDKLDQAYELFEPLINNLVKKRRDEKAIGLLGLILESQKPHLPALERLALIYRTNKEVKKLEVVDRAILDELRRQGLKDRMVTVYGELLDLRPDDADLAREARSLRQELGLAAEEVLEEEPALSEKDREAIRDVIAQADLYLQQGLVRIARRLLENLRFRYPEDPQILRKIAVLDEVRTHMDEDEIRRRVEKTSKLEAEIKEKAAEKKAQEKRAETRPEAKAPVAAPAEAPKKPKPAFREDALEGEKVSTADIFAETDIIPFIGAEPGERAYYDLRGLAADELAWLAAARARQLEGDGSPLEKALSTIVTEFRKELRDKGGASGPEARYQLGLAFLSQGLTAEAVEELTQAAEDKSLAVASYSLISKCYRQKRSFDEAAKWLEKGLAEAKPGTEQYYALAYELAEVKEAADDRARAAALFREVHAWNPGYRDVAARFRRLENWPAQ